ncbi:MAG: tetratricopeptide repeat protein [bacterium]|nr:tetratricopeptide repeat protein [bacterium]
MRKQWFSLAALIVAIAGMSFMLMGCDAVISGALVHIQQNDYEGAIRVLHDGLAQTPGNGQYYALLAQCYVTTRQFKEAGPAYEMAIKNWPDKKDSLIKARDYEWALLINSAQKNLKQMATVAPESVKAYSDNVLKYLNQAVDFAPDKADNYALYGSYHSLSGKPEEAKKMFEKALKMDPNNVKLNLTIARNISQTGNLDEAIKYYQKYNGLKKDDFEGYLELGKIYLQKKMYAEAAEAFNQAVALKKDDFLSVYLLGNAYLQIGKYQEAVQAFTASSVIDPNNKNAWYNLGQAYYSAKDYTKAAENFDKVVKIDNKDLEAWVFVGYLSEKVKDYQKALDAYKTLVTLKPESVEYWGSLSQVYVKMGRKAEAEDAAKKAKALEKK